MINSNENMPPYPQWQTMEDGPPESIAQKKHPKKQFIGDKNMEEEVHELWLVNAIREYISG